MARFFFLDQSLKGVGGHHYDYALHILRGAEALGFETVLGAHRSFRDDGQMPVACEIDAVFRHSVYNRFSDFSPNKSNPVESNPVDSVNVPSPTAPPSFWQRWVQQRRTRHRQQGRARVIRHFAEDCRKLFGPRAHQFGDQVFLATISDLELLGLAEYARHEPTSRLVQWHCQFHFNLFHGRPQEYAEQQATLEQCRRRFAEALEILRQHQVCLYNTSRELADQYQRLGVGQFQPLAYPVNPTFQPRVSDEPPGGAAPLRVTLAGAVRREKGQRDLTELVREINSSLLESGRVSLVVQQKRRSRFRRQQIDLAREVGEMSTESQSAIEYVEHPLRQADYERMMKQADVGLFLYDGRTYYARRAGVMGEFLSLGTPVIVPAGCWLAEQLRVAQEQYHLSLIHAGDATLAAPRLMAVSEPAVASVPGIACRVTADNPFRIDFQVPRGCRKFVFRGRVRREQGETNFAQLEIAQVTSPTEDATPTASTMAAEATSPARTSQPRCLQSAPATFAAVLGSTPREQSSSTAAVIAHHTADHVAVTLTPAFGAAAVTLEDFELYSVTDDFVPLGAVGLIAATRDSVPCLLEELQEHYRHYRATAAEFATQWHADHDPKEVLRQLLNRAQPSRWHAA